MSARVALLAALALCLVGGCSCGKKEKAGATPAAATTGTAAAAPFQDAIVAKLKDEGFKVGTFESTAPEPYGARNCGRGTVDQLEVLLCQFPDAAAAQAGEKKLNSFASGAVSGASRRADAVTMTVADRAKVDLSGKRISRILRVLGPPPAAAPAAPAPADTKTKA